MQFALTLLLLVVFSSVMVVATFALSFGAFWPREWLALLALKGADALIVVPTVFMANFLSAYDLAVYLRYKAGATARADYPQVHENEHSGRALTMKEKAFLKSFFFLFSALIVFAAYSDPSN